MGKEYYKLIGACGLYCATCNIYRSHKTSDRERQEEIIRGIFGENSDVKPEDVTCDGCRGAMDLHWSPSCEIMLCARNRKLLACSQCPDFPCELLENFWSRGYDSARKNALRQREMGLRRWLEELDRGIE
mgnify:CR=1 FL=1